MSLHSLPLFVRLAGRPVILLGDGDAAAAKRQLLERAGARVVGEAADAALAIVAIDDETEAEAAVARLKARGILVNAVDRPAWCDFTLPAIVERDPVIVAIGTGGASAGLSAALRQRFESLLPATLGGLATSLEAAREAIRDTFPDAIQRRRALASALSPGGKLDPLTTDHNVAGWLATHEQPQMGDTARICLSSDDPDDLTVRDARLLANADRLYHRGDVPPAILDRARADAVRIVSAAPPVEAMPGLTVYVEKA